MTRKNVLYSCNSVQISLPLSIHNAAPVVQFIYFVFVFHFNGPFPIGILHENGTRPEEAAVHIFTRCSWLFCRSFDFYYLFIPEHGLDQKFCHRSFCVFFNDTVYLVFNLFFNYICVCARRLYSDQSSWRMISCLCGHVR